MKALRRAVSRDRERIERFQKTAYARTEAVIGAPAIPLEWDYAAVLSECEVWLDDGDGRLDEGDGRLDEGDGRLAGVLILLVQEDRLFLKSIATDPDHSGTGGGRRLMEAAFLRARSLGLGKIALVTNSRNPAVGWYRKLGFVVDFEELQSGRMVLHMTAHVTGEGINAAGDSM